MKKSQVSVTDLIMSVSIFIALAAFIIYYWSATASRFDNDINYEELQLKATRIADQLAKTPGDPSKWEVVWKTDMPHVYSLGLASSDRILSDKKIFNLSEMASTQQGYDDIRRLLNIEGYDFNITVKVKDDIITLLRKFDIRVAYIQVGAKSFPESLEEALKGFFDCKSADLITNRKLERCEEYTSNSLLNNPDGSGTAFAANFNIFENLSEYDLLIMEDPRLTFTIGSASEPTFAHSQKIINFTKNGGFAIFTIGLSDATPGSPPQYLMGVNWTIGGGNPTTLTVTEDYYEAVNNGDETFVDFPGTIEVPDVFSTNKKDSYINTWKPNESVGLLKMLYPNTDVNKVTGARWEFGKGRIYYFSDGRDTTISDEVGVASRRIVLGLASSLFSSLINSGRAPPKDANIVTVQRDVIFNNKSAILEFSLWKQK